MYQPPQFHIDSRAECHRAIEDAPFATLVTRDASGELCADHLPLLLTPAGGCLLYTSPSPRDKRQSRMPSSA